MNEVVVSNLTATAWELARIQIEGVQDFVGFSNADKNVGAHLASVVEADPSNEDAVRRLAALVGIKYQRQVQGLAEKGFIPGNMPSEFKTLAKGTKLTPEDRFAARMTVVAQPDVHPKFGERVLFSFQLNQDFGYALKNNGAKAFNGPDGWKWAVRPANVNAAVAALKACGANIVGSYDVSNIDAEEAVKSHARIVLARLDGKFVFLSFQNGYDRDLVNAVKELPGRKYDGQTREWRIKATDLAVAAEALSRAGDDVDVSALVKLADQVPQTARPVEVAEPEVKLLDEMIPSTAMDYQREGIDWLIQGLAEARKSVVGGSSIRGKILGDKPGLGKTLQVEVAAKAILETVQENGRIVVITPANYKIGWAREIAKFCGKDQSVHVCYGQVPPNPNARWNVINYDILLDHYDALVQMGFDILIIDEAHYIKNYEAERSKLVLGGKVSFPVQLSAAEVKRITDAFEKDAKKRGKSVDKRDLRKALNPTKAKRIEGLAAAATTRVFPLTGTPLANRPKDLFNLLKAIGHPLGKNFKQFALRYCAPSFKKVGNRIFTEYKGSSNLEELRERIAPVFLQRFEVPGLKPLMRDWATVEVDTEAYRKVMAEYEARRKSGELSSMDSHLALLSEARVCAAVAKIPATISRIEDALEAEEKVIVFSSYTKCIEKFAKHFGDKAVVFDGSKSTKQRQDAIDRFQTDDSVRVFIGQTIAAGVAITLTAATQVKFNDLDWVPANLLQAEKRAHRFGQTQTVFVEYMVAAGTFDEELATLLEEKMEQVNEFEGTQTSLFLNLIDRLNHEAPKNAEARDLMRARERKAAGLPSAA